MSRVVRLSESGAERSVWELMSAIWEGKKYINKCKQSNKSAMQDTHTYTTMYVCIR